MIIEAVQPGAVHPLFPLPDLVLVPGVVQALHIFEPRYRQMTSDVLDSSGRLIIGTVLSGKDDGLTHGGSEQPVQPVAGLGQIERYERLEGGRFLIYLFGVARIRLEEVPSNQPYRLAKVGSFDEEPISDSEAKSFRRRLTAAIMERPVDASLIPVSAPLGHLADLLLLHSELEPSVLYKAFAEPSVRERARMALQHRLTS